MRKFEFVGRKSVLDVLDKHMLLASSGQGNVLFVSGEAGSGKTAVLDAFAKTASHQALVVKGICNAQTGSGNPYQPFREIIAALIGDYDLSLEQGKINDSCAITIEQEMISTISILINHAPNLIDILIPQSKLETLMENYISKHDEKQNAKELLYKIIHRSKSKKNGAVGQANVFDEILDFLALFSQKYSLVLLIDDLQWADSASINLLSFLGHKIEKLKIFIIGTYRPEEILVGREDKYHPLTKVLAELKRTFGNIFIDLDKLSKSDRQNFINEILDSEPNILDQNFRESLYHHTQGHALFTAELLRSMKERGIVFLDGNGKWTTTSIILWDKIPARVEGIIEERINRLEPELQEILSLASVEGEDFTAEIIAQLRELSEKIILRQLSQELEKRHRLVQEQGEIKINRHRLQRFQFSHALFQQYFYNQLGTGQKRILHEEIAKLLEEIYEKNVDDVLMQLVHHYSESGNQEKAMNFLMKAGDLAARSFAFTEARLHYRRAKEILVKLPDIAENRYSLVELIFKYMTVSSSSDNPQEAINLSVDAEKILTEFLESEQAQSSLFSQQVLEKLARIYLWTGRAYYNSNQLYDAIRYYNKVIPVAQQIQNDYLMAMATGLMGRSLATQGQFAKAELMMREAQETIEKSESWHDWIWNTEFLASCLAVQGRFNDGLILAQKGLAKAEKISYLMALTMSHSHLALIYRAANNATAMLAHSITATEIAEQSGDRLFVYIGYALQAWANLMDGNIDDALNLIKTSTKVRQGLSENLVRMDWFIAVESEILLASGDFQNSIKCAEKAIRIAQPTGGIFSQGLAHRTWGQAWAALAPHQWDEVESHLLSALHFFEAGNALIEVARTKVVWGNLCQNRGNLELARTYYLEAVEKYQLTDTRQEIPKIYAWIAQLDSMQAATEFIERKIYGKITEKSINSATIQTIKARDILMTNFDDTELDALCMDYFPVVYNKFSRGLRKDEKVNILIDFCRKSPADETKLMEILDKTAQK